MMSQIYGNEISELGHFYPNPISDEFKPFMGAGLFRSKQFYDDFSTRFYYPAQSKADLVRVVHVTDLR